MYPITRTRETSLVGSAPSDTIYTLATAASMAASKKFILRVKANPVGG